MKTSLKWFVGTVAALATVAPALAGVGDLDPRFGLQGSVTVWDNAGPSVLELPDGRILVVGTTTWASWPRRITVQRFLANGAADVSFGTNGRALVDLPTHEAQFVSVAALQADGKIVIAGSIWDDGGRPFVARLDAQGALDASFAIGGIWVGGGTEPFYSAMLITSAGEILAAISDWTSDRIDRFDTEGRYLGSLSGEIAPHRLAQQGDGRLIVSGYHRSLKASVVTRLDLQGDVDRSFGQDGFAVLGQAVSHNLAIEPGGDRIVLCGPAIMRLTSDGRPDPTFGNDGTGIVAFGSGDVPASDFCYRVLALQGGAVIYVGIRQGLAAGGYDQALIGGLTSAGTADRRSGSGSGVATLGFGPLKATPEPWFDMGATLIGTRSGDALLTWVTAAEYPTLVLARIDLGSGASLPTEPVPEATQPPPVATSPPPASAPAAPAPSSAAGSGSGGGRADWALLLLGLAAGLARACPRTIRRVGSAARFRPGST
jgi:uncharacterized delta-60 repeat protein